MLHYLRNKKVLFITTKNIDYIRNTQEITLLSECAQSYTVIASAHKSYFKRLLFIYCRLLFLRVTDYDTVFAGFAPQLILPVFFWKWKSVDIVEDFFISFHDTLCCDRKNTSQTAESADFSTGWMKKRSPMQMPFSVIPTLTATTLSGNFTLMQTV